MENERELLQTAYATIQDLKKEKQHLKNVIQNDIAIFEMRIKERIKKEVQKLSIEESIEYLTELLNELKKED